MATYKQIVIESARGYIQQLENISGRSREQARTVCKLYERALSDASDAKIWSAFEDAVEAVKYREAFCNQYSLGMGNPDAFIVFVGQGWAFELDNTPNFIAEASLLTLIWMLDVQRKEKLLAGVSEWLQENFGRKAIDLSLPFNRFPNNFHQVKKAAHTWAIMSSFIASLLGKKVTLETGSNNFAKHSCFMELGAKPKARNQGVNIESPRKEFLKDILSSLLNAKGLTENKLNSL